MPPRDLSYLTDILEAAKQIRAFVHGVDKEQFDGSAIPVLIKQIEPLISPR